MKRVYQLYWSQYLQWTREFDNDQDAVAAVKAFTEQPPSLPLAEFRLLRLDPVPLS